MSGDDRALAMLRQVKKQLEKIHQSTTTLPSFTSVKQQNNSGARDEISEKRNTKNEPFEADGYEHVRSIGPSKMVRAEA